MNSSNLICYNDKLNHNVYNIQILSMICLIFFSLSSSIVTLYANFEMVYVRSDNLDIRYPAAFIHVLQILETLFLICGILWIPYNFNNGCFGCLILAILSCFVAI